MTMLTGGCGARKIGEWHIGHGHRERAEMPVAFCLLLRYLAEESAAMLGQAKEE
jgi:hypothetical protein